MGAFLRSLLLPGWGQAVTGRPVAGAVFATWEGVSAMMTLKAQSEFHYMREAGSVSVGAKRQEVQDWLVLWIFNHLFSGAEAFVSAHLQDFPKDLRVRAFPGGAATVNRAPLGVFDSGIGGLTVARALFERLPHESVIYFGDTARVPYGPKSPDTVRRYAGEILAYLLGRGVKALVVACNTISAHALEYLSARCPVPLVGVIEPGARAAVAATRSGKIGVIGTAGTIASGAYERAIKALRPETPVCVQACPLFVPLVEEGWFDHPATELIARQYLEPLQRAGVDVLVLGCTHYPLLKPLLARVLGPGVTLVDSAEETAKVAAAALDQGGLTTAPDAAAVHRFVVSDDEPHFRKVGARFLGEKLQIVEVVPLG